MMVCNKPFVRAVLLISVIYLLVLMNVSKVKDHAKLAHQKIMNFMDSLGDKNLSGTFVEDDNYIEGKYTSLYHVDLVSSHHKFLIRY